MDFFELKRYYQAWGVEIGKIMGIAGSRAAVLFNHVDFKIQYQKQWRISNELKEIIKKCRFQKSGGGGNRRFALIHNPRGCT